MTFAVIIMLLFGWLCVNYYAQPFTILVEPVKDEIAKYDSVDNAETRERLLTSFLSSILNRLSKFLVKVGAKTL